jgi:DNA polymerase-3 subunit epsilon
MRQVVLDTETTGLEVERGHRVIEIGCVELVNRRRTRKTYHQYLQPDREIDEAAEQVHGISLETLADKPRFKEVVDEFLEFIDGAELVIHNADFDVGFLNRELELADRGGAGVSERCTILDSLILARQLHPGQRNSLDALCKRYEIDDSRRDRHGALLDAELLADVYLAMTGGQGALSLDKDQEVSAGISSRIETMDRAGLALRVIAASRDELKAHEHQLDCVDQASADGSLWRRADN